MRRNRRSQLIAAMRNRIERLGYPRLRMMLLIMLTGSVGFIASYSLLLSGLSDMPTRYFLASLSAYAAFMMLLWLWLRTSSDDYTEIPDLTGLIDSTPSASSHSTFEGHGGSFGGGGSSGSFNAPETDESIMGHAGEFVSGAAEADEFAIPLVLAILVASLLLSSLLIVYSAPVLFAELLVDGVLAAGLYGRLQRIDSRHWLETAIRRTFWPFAITTMLVVSCGFALQQYAPAATSIGDVTLLIKQQR